MIQKLNVKFTIEEVEIALKQMAPLKAPGPYGFGSCFFHKHWKIEGDDVCAMVLQNLHGEGMSSLLN